MQQKLINNITVSNRILILFLLMGTLFVAKSIFLIMFITVLTAIILVLIEKNVKLYVEALKRTVFWLLFLAVIYIIIFRDTVGLLVFEYKIILSIILLTGFMQSINFGMLADGIYTILSLLNKKLSNLDKTAYNITRYIYFYGILMSSGSKIQKSQQLKNKRRMSLKYYLLPKLFYAIDEISKLESGLKLNFYKVKREKNDANSNVILLFFVILFIFAVFKEVIL